MVAEALLHEMLGEMIGNGTGANGIEGLHVQLDAFADDAFHQHLAGPTSSGVRMRRESSEKCATMRSVRQLDAIAFNPWKDDLELRALFDRLHAHGRLRGLRRRNHGIGREVERNAHNVAYSTSNRLSSFSS